MDKDRLEALLEEAMVDCYDEHEAFMGVLYTLDERLNFPFQARALGELVEVIGLNDSHSDLRHGIAARVRKGGQEYRLSLADLEFVATLLLPVGRLEVGGTDGPVSIRAGLAPGING